VTIATVAYVLDGGGTRGLVRSLDNLMPGAWRGVVFRGAWTGDRSGPHRDVGRIRQMLAKGDRSLMTGDSDRRAGRAGREADFDAVIAIDTAFSSRSLRRGGIQSAFLLDVIETALEARVRPASERPLRVYHDWGLYGHASTREARDLRAANRRFNAYLRSKGYQPAGGEAKDGDGWASWRNRTDQLFAALFPPVAKEPR
jgi:hypothetical protein